MRNSAAEYKRTRVDSQMTGLAGELFVAAELLKRELQTSVTFGSAKSVDLLAYNPRTKIVYPVQVKTLRSANYFLLAANKVEKHLIYVFVLLNKPGQMVRYFVVPGEDLAANPERFSKAFMATKMPGILPSTLMKLGYENAWDIFDGNSADCRN